MTCMNPAQGNVKTEKKPCVEARTNNTIDPHMAPGQKSNLGYIAGLVGEDCCFFANHYGSANTASKWHNSLEDLGDVKS